MTAEERHAQERAAARAPSLPPESWAVQMTDEPPCARCGSMRTWSHRSWCEDCDPDYAQAML